MQLLPQLCHLCSRPNRSGNSAEHRDIAGWHETLTSSRIRTPVPPQGVTTGSGAPARMKGLHASIKWHPRAQRRTRAVVRRSPRGAEQCVCVDVRVARCCGERRNCGRVSAEPTRTFAWPLNVWYLCVQSNPNVLAKTVAKR